MELNWYSGSKIVFIPLLFLAAISSTSAAVSLSGSVFDSDGASVGGRYLLQAKTPCPVNFEFQNYTIITSQCKGPQYPPKLCCPAFTEFACPFADQLNDLTNDCSATMFSYINLYGKYPPGLFASECKGDKQGLSCTDSQAAADSSASLITNPSSLLMIISTFVIILLGWY